MAARRTPVPSGTRVPRFLGFRTYQREFWDARDAGVKRSILVWHRRAGKDLAVLNRTIADMLQRPGTYYYFFPTYAQAKKVIWDGQDKSGRPFLANFPPELLDGGDGTSKGMWQDEMRIRLRLPQGGHSTFQLVGTDKMDSIVGTNPIGCVFSEYSLMNPRAWDLARPILAENGGWAVFVYTPRGKNHGYKLWRDTAGDPGWFRSLRTVDDTLCDAIDPFTGQRAEPADPMRADVFGKPVVPIAVIEAERRSGMEESLIQQEFYCSFEGALHGSYFGDLMVRAREEGRIRPGLYEPTARVDTAWDLGIDDATAIGFTQTLRDHVGRPVPRFIDYHDDAGHGLDHYIALLKKKDYGYRYHYGPHDLKTREMSTGNTRKQFAESLGLYFDPVPKLSVADGIQAARKLITLAEFDEEKCDRLISALMAYRREWDDKMMTWRSTPVHDWASHGADMTRYRGVAWFDESGTVPQDSYSGGWSPLDATEAPEKTEGEDWNVFSAGR